MLLKNLWKFGMLMLITSIWLDISIRQYKVIWTNIEDLKNIELSALPVYGDKSIKTKIETYYDTVYTNFHGLNVPEDDIECQCFTVFSIDSLFVCKNKYYLPVCLDNCAYKIANKQMTDYLDEDLLED